VNRLRARIWRTPVLLLAVMLATLAPVSAPATAVGSGSMEWTGTRWQDPVCDTANETFDLRLFRHADYQGTEWRVCGSKINFCYSPYGIDSPAGALCLNAGYDGETMNDYPSSFKLISIAGGSSCRVQMKEHAGYTGGGLVEWDPVNRTSMFPYNDAVSSARRVC
jgi:hypothetical protein